MVQRYNLKEPMKFLLADTFHNFDAAAYLYTYTGDKANQVLEVLVPLPDHQVSQARQSSLSTDQLLQLPHARFRRQFAIALSDTTPWQQCYLFSELLLTTVPCEPARKEHTFRNLSLIVEHTSLTFSGSVSICAM